MFASGNSLKKKKKKKKKLRDRKPHSSDSPTPPTAPLKYSPSLNISLTSGLMLLHAKCREAVPYVCVCSKTLSSAFSLSLSLSLSSAQENSQEHLRRESDTRVALSKIGSWGRNGAKALFNGERVGGCVGRANKRRRMKKMELQKEPRDPKKKKACQRSK